MARPIWLIGSGGVSTAATMKAMTIAHLRFSASALRRQQPDARHQAGHHRQLEHQAEGEDQRHDQAEIFRHFRQQRNLHLIVAAGLLHGQEEPHHHRREEEIDQRRAHQEQDRRGDQERQEGVALVLVEAGRDEFVDLRGDQRKGDDHAAEHRELDLGEEEFLRRRVDQLDLVRIEARPFDRPFERDDQQVEQPAWRRRSRPRKATKKPPIDQISRRRSSIRCSISGADDFSISSFPCPKRSLGGSRRLLGGRLLRRCRLRASTACRCSLGRALAWQPLPRRRPWRPSRLCAPWPVGFAAAAAAAPLAGRSLGRAFVGAAPSAAAAGAAAGAGRGHDRAVGHRRKDRRRRHRFRPR